MSSWRIWRIRLRSPRLRASYSSATSFSFGCGMWQECMWACVCPRTCGAIRENQPLPGRLAPYVNRTPSYGRDVDPYVLEPDRLRLRPYRAEDLDALAAILGDPEMMRFYSRPFTREESAAWIHRNKERYDQEGLGLLAMELKDTEEFVGNCGPTRQTVEGTQEIELGWHLAKHHW